MEPGGAGYEFIDEIKGGVIPREFIPSVDKGIRDTLPNGIAAGYPVVDVRVRLIFGSSTTLTPLNWPSNWQRLKPSKKVCVKPTQLCWNQSWQLRWKHLKNTWVT